jgi:hypothetical protein
MAALYLLLAGADDATAPGEDPETPTTMPHPEGSTR